MTLVIRSVRVESRRAAGEFPGRESAILAGFVLVSLIEGWGLANGRHALALFPPAAVAVLLLARRAWLPAVVVLVLASTFASAYALPAASLLKLNVYPVEGMLVLGLLSLPLMRTRVPSGALGAAMIVFLTAALIGVFVGHAHGGGGIVQVARDGRVVGLYASLWLFAVGFAADRRAMFRIIGALALIVVVLEILQLVAGRSHAIFLTGPGSDVLTVESGGFLRVRPPGLILVYVALIFGCAYLIWGPARRRLTAGLVVFACGGGVALSLNRNMYVGMALGLLTAAVIAPKRAGAYLTVFAGIGAVIAALLLVGPLTGAVSNTTVGKRVLSLGSVHELQATTLADRRYENGRAVEVLKHHPVTGIGWGTSYGALLRRSVGGVPIIEDRQFIHEQYLGLWLRTGILGLTAFLVLLGAAALRAARWTRAPAVEDDRWIGPALLASLVAVAVSSTVGIYILNPGSAVPLSALLGLAATLRLQARDERTSSGV